MSVKPHELRPRGRKPCMRLTGMLGEAVRDLITGTTHACALAVSLACLIALLAGADWMTIAGIQRQTDEYVASGGSTWVLEYNDHIDGAACDRLASLDGVQASGAVRQTDESLVFAALPSTGVPIYETTPGALAVFALGTTGTQSEYGAGDLSSAPPIQGVMLSTDAAAPFRAQSGQRLALKDGRNVDVSGVFDWPEDGRKAGFSYAALAPVPAGSEDAFSQCWVRTWPQTTDIESLLRLAADNRATDSTQAPPTVSRLNTSKGAALDSAFLFSSRLTAAAPWVALVISAALGFVATRMRRLEMASALHCGVPKTALLAQIMMETLVWSLSGALLASPLPAWIWLAGSVAEASAVIGALLCVFVTAVIGALSGAAAAVLLTRESRLLRYFRNR
ncbi:hypothetical protein [Bifidobacterium catulorum]|nr:hypothetical protein [Bifidobacterium catulorum]